MIRFKKEYDDILPLKRIYVGNESIAAVYYNGRLIWPITNEYGELLSCYANGYWIDEYPWTDDTPWADNN